MNSFQQQRQQQQNKNQQHLIYFMFDYLSQVFTLAFFWNHPFHPRIKYGLYFLCSHHSCIHPFHQRPRSYKWTKANCSASALVNKNGRENFWNFPIRWAQTLQLQVGTHNSIYNDRRGPPCRWWFFTDVLGYVYFEFLGKMNPMLTNMFCFQKGGSRLDSDLEEFIETKHHPKIMIS